MQAAFYIREKQKLRLKNNGSAAGLPPGITAAQLRRLGRIDRLPSNVATRDIAPFPTFPPNTWVRLCLVTNYLPIWLYGKRILFNFLLFSFVTCHIPVTT